MNSNFKICVIGMGYVGMSLSLALAEKDYNVTCFDVNKEKIVKLKKGSMYIYEEGFEKSLKKNHNKLTFVEELPKSDFYFICVNTPSLKNGKCDTSRIKDCINNIINISKTATIIIKSTCEIGTCRKMQKMVNKLNANNTVIFSPEFLAQGSAYENSINPDRIVLGGENQKALSILQKIFSAFTQNIYAMDWESAETVKYASNALLATKVSAINEIANLCEKTGANILEVSKAVGEDKRIGKSFLKAGCGFGGSCFEKDLKALMSIAEIHNIDMKVFNATLQANNHQRLTVVEKLKRRLKSLCGKTIAVLGLAFKKGTNDARESVALYVVNELINNRANLKLYDPQACESFKYEFKTKFDKTINENCFYPKIQDAIKNIDACIVLTDWDEIVNLKLKDKNVIIIDGRNCLKYIENSIKVGM